MSPIETLPDEILLNILKEFDVQFSIVETAVYRINDPKTALLNLSICSKRLHQIAVPFIFHTLVQSGTHSLPALVRRLLAAPQAGRFVKTIFCDASVDLFDVDFTVEEFSECSKLIKSATPTCEMALSWLTDLKAGLLDPLIALLMLQTPCLEEIYISGRGTDIHVSKDELYVRQVLANAAELQVHNDPSSSHLSQLKSALLYYHQDYNANERGTRFASIEPFLGLESLEKLTVSNLVIEDEDEEPLIDQSKTYYLKDLQIHDSACSGDKMVKLLSCFKSLEVLEYIHGGAVIGYSDYHPQIWGRAIAHLTSTLQRLVLFGNPADNCKSDDADSIGSLFRFQHLKEIVANFPTLRGPTNSPKRLIDILPKSLKKLEVVLCDDDFVQQMTELLQRKNELVPALDIVVAEPHWLHLDIEKPLLEVCKAAGVRLKFFRYGAPRERN